MQTDIGQIYQQNISPLSEQEQLRLAAMIINRISDKPASANREKKTTAEHPLTTIRKMAVDVGVSDFAERHDFYANGKLED